MSVMIASLNSGSNGNAYYVGTAEEAVLIDAGISCRETERRMSKLGLSMEKLKAVFISHEHNDHIGGVAVLARKYRLPIYITSATETGMRIPAPISFIRRFQTDEPISIGQLQVTGFSKTHDAADPHSFIIQHRHIQVGVFTDIGRVCDNLKKHFSQCHAAFLESNYDADMLEQGRYPEHLKRRIRGGEGHLSNEEAWELFQQHRGEQLSHLLLSHLSRNNNTHEKVKEVFSRDLGNTHIIIASRYRPSEVYKITGTDADKPQAAPAVPVVEQLRLF
ncbi:MAG: MBL fold metallo-hydrolase [Bacteroidota bacterium]